MNPIKELIHRENSKITLMNQRNFDSTITLFKVFLMICVVGYHYGDSGGFSHPFFNWFPYWIFFMEGFVFISGYFYNPKSEDHPLKSIGKKALSLLVPLYLWNLFYGILITILRYFDLARFYDWNEKPFNLQSLLIEPWIGNHQYSFNIPAWFVPSLFIIYSVYLLIRTLLTKLHIYNDYIMLILSFAISFFSIYMVEQGYRTGIYLTIFKAGVMFFAYQFGYFYHTHMQEFLRNKKCLLLFLLMIIRYVSIAFFDGESLVQEVVWLNMTGHPAHILLSKVIGILFFLTLCDCVAPAFEKNRFVRFFSNNTFSVMMHHLTVLYFINLFIYFVSTYIHPLGGFNETTFKTTIYYRYCFWDSRIIFFYFLLGIIIPLGLRYLYEKVIRKLDSSFSK